MRDRYRLCDMAVTVYHRDGAGEITRTVHRRAFLDFRKNYNVNKTGSKEANGFLLLMPGDVVPVAVGDKVVLGEGPEVATDAAWRDFIPAKVPGLAVVKYVDPKYYKGRLAHTEAGG